MRPPVAARAWVSVCAVLALALGSARVGAEAPGLARAPGGAGSARVALEASPSERPGVRAALRAELIEHLRPWPGPRTDLGSVSRVWFERDGVEARLVQITTHPDVRMTCALLAPTAPATRRPALLLLHGMGGTLRSVVDDVDYHHGFGFDLARRGFVVLAPYRVTASAGTRNTLHVKARVAGWSLDAIELWQLTRALDYLLSRSEVDPRRVGVYGISLGGKHALELAAVDERLSLVVSSGHFTDRFAWLFQRRAGIASRPPTGRMAEAIAPEENPGFQTAMGILLDDLNLVALIAPRHLAIVSGTRDPRHAGAQREFDKAERLYARLGAPDRLAWLSFAGGHETSVASVAPFLERWAAGGDED